MKIDILLEIAAYTQLGIGIANLFLVRILKWKEDVNRMPLLLKEVFYVHSWFITLVVFIFGGSTLRFLGEMVSGGNEVLDWLATSIGIFWLFRALLQVAWYSSSHWKGHPGLTVIHVLAFLVYSGMGSIYIIAGLGGGGTP